MASPSHTHPLRARAIFSETARVPSRLADHPVITTDPVTGITCSLRHDFIGPTLRLSGGPLGIAVITTVCDEGDANLIATLLIDGIAAQRPA